MLTGIDFRPATAEPRGYDGDKLYKINLTTGIATPNGGTINTIGSLGIGAFGAVTGFDIITVNGVNTAYFSAMAAGSNASQLYTLNLDTGAATLVGTVAGTSLTALSLQPVPEPATWALMLSGLLGVGMLVRRLST